MSNVNGATEALMGGLIANSRGANFWTGVKHDNSIYQSGEYPDFNIKRGYGMRYGGGKPKVSTISGVKGVALNDVIVNGLADNMKGIGEIGITGTFCIGIGGSLEFGLASDGVSNSLYFRADFSIGIDVSYGGVMNYHTPVEINTNLTYDIVANGGNGFSEGHNYAVGIFDISDTGNSNYPGLWPPENYSDAHLLYNTDSFGVSGGLPIGYTRSKGLTWYFFKF